MKTDVNWNRVADAMVTPLVFAVCYTCGEAGFIAAIALGAEETHVLLKAGWIIGLICGFLVMYFISVRPKNKLLKDYNELTTDMLLVMHEQKAKIEELQQNRRIEGDEWKDG